MERLFGDRQWNRYPYPLTIEYDAVSGGYVVSDDVTQVYGFAETLDAALDDYDVSLAEWREWEAMTSAERAAWSAAQPELPPEQW